MLLPDDDPEVVRTPVPFTDASLVMRGHIDGREVELTVGQLVFEPGAVRIVQDFRDQPDVGDTKDRDVRVPKDYTRWYVEMQGRMVMESHLPLYVVKVKEAS